MLKKIIFIWPSMDFLLSNNEFLGKSVFFDALSIDSSYFTQNRHLFLSIIIFLIVLYALGIGRRVTSILLFLAWYILQKLNIYILNGGDVYLLFILLYMCFADSYSHLVLNKSNAPEKGDISNFLTNLSVHAIIIHLCLIYFVAGIVKIHSDVWYNGVALYYILNLERFSGTEYNSLLARNGFLVTMATYGTMLLETLFPFLVSLRITKIPALVAGILLHLSIYFFMMIYDFEVLYIMVYGFFFTDDEILNLKRNILSRISKLFQFIYKPAN